MRSHESEPSDKVKPAYSPSGDKAKKPKPSSPPCEEGKSSIPRQEDNLVKAAEASFIVADDSNMIRT